MKHILITGASSGIGYELVNQLRIQNVIIWAAVRNTDSVKEFKQSNPHNFSSIQMDITSDTDVEKCFLEIEPQIKEDDEFVLINNAGVANGGPIEGMSIDEWRYLYEVNVFGLVRVTKTFLPLLRKTNGLILNIGSISGRIASPFLASYSSSKFAVRAITDSLRREVKDRSVKVVLVEPGPIKTQIWNKSISSSEKSAEQYQDIVKQAYAHQISYFKRTIKKTSLGAMPVQEAAQKIVKIIHSKHPKKYYLIGKNIFLVSFILKLMPTSLLDKILTLDLTPKQ